MSQERRAGKRPSWSFLLSTLLAFLGASIFWRVTRFWRRLLRQPRLTRVLRSTSYTADLIDDAMRIAAENVRQAIEERHLPDGSRKLVLNAGWRNFREPWARDFAFASCGLLELGETRVLNETLELFLLFQRENGQFPVKIHSTNVLERFLYSLMGRQQPIHAPLRPKHKTAHNTISLDGNALLIISALNYLRQVEDEAFAHRHWRALKRGLRWLETRALEADGLLHQGAFTDWADSIGRSGCIHYTNVLYWRALREFARDAAKYGYGEDHVYFAEKEAQLRAAINEHFWREELGFYRTSEQFGDLLSSAGNLLAIAWGLATPEQANAILDAMIAYGMADPVPTKVTNQEYGKGFVAIENRLAGIPHYHTSAAWLWLGAWHVIALARVKRLEEARELLTRMSALIVRDGVVHEVYGEDGRYLSTLWYTSEAPLTWSASMFVYAAAVCRRACEEGAG